MKLKVFVSAWILIATLSAKVMADPIPYPNVGTPNPVTYTFTAASTGDVIAYFAGSGAAFDNQLGLLVNGVQTPEGFGLDNHTSFLGQSFNLGHANAGDTLVFILHNLSLGKDAYSDPALNIPYDTDGSRGHNHVYSTPYTATSPIIDSIPVGLYVAFEDLPFPGSDFNYHDEDFVFVNVQIGAPVPEPAALLLAGVGVAGLCGYAWRRRRTAEARGGRESCTDN
jgi:hypothetical protein